MSRITRLLTDEAQLNLESPFSGQAMRRQACQGLFILFAVFGPAPMSLLSTTRPVRAEEPIPENNPKAREYVRACLQRYRRTNSYKDDGRILIRINETTSQTASPGGDQTGVIERSAPMKTYFDRTTLRITAYDVRIAVERGELRSWLVPPDSIDTKTLERNDTSIDLFRQISVKRLSPGRLRLDELLHDPVIANQLSAGLAGPPITLSWLFSEGDILEEPRDSRWSFIGRKNIDQLSCVGVSVSSTGQSSTMWIDPETGMIRRIDLPPGKLGAADFELKIDLRGATFTVRDPPPPLEQYPTEWFKANVIKVDQILIPPAPLPSQIGRSLDFVRPGVMVVLSGDAAMIKASRETLDSLNLKDSEIQVEREGQTSPGIHLIDGRRRLLTSAIPQDQTSFAILASMLGDLKAGVDVLSRLRVQHQEARELYRRQIPPLAGVERK
ncbi:MAG: hypothetical protein AAF664_03020 [Planctomycetota bacterium]